MTSKSAPNFFVLLILSLMISSVVSCTIFTPTPLLTATSIPTTTSSPTALPSLTATPTSNEIYSTPTELPEQIDVVAVHYYYDADFFPTEWLEEPPSCVGGQFDLVEAPRVISDIKEFISAYDFSF